MTIAPVPTAAASVHSAAVMSVEAEMAQVTITIDALFARKFAASNAYGEQARRLWETASQTIRGGKGVRPRVLLSAYKALTGTTRATGPAIEAAAAVELLHYAFLLHDDVIDSDTMRRGRPNLLGAMAADIEPSPRAAHWGSTASILMGDLVLSAAYQAFSRIDLPTEARRRVLDVLDATIDETVVGELMDVALSDGVRTPSLSAILDMAANKTATYTFELPLRIAAILADAAEDTEQALAKAGRQLGLAFQLDDDLLGVFGDSSYGKDTRSDLAEGKQTALIAFARHTDEWAEIEPLFGRADLTEADAFLVRGLLIQCGAKEKVEALRDAALAYVFDACKSDSRLVPPAIADVLNTFATGLAGRRS